MSDEAAKHLRPANAEEVNVTFADQQLINTFGRLHVKSLELEDQMTVKKQELDNIGDCAGDIENLFDEDACKIKIGEIFFEVSNEEALEFVQKKTEKIKSEYKEMAEQQNKIKKELDTLRASLKAKFGNSINLEA